jgi:hypothetical protein
MRTALNPFWVFVVVAAIVLIAIVVISQRRNATHAPTAANAPGVTTGLRIPAAPAALGLAVVLVPVGIAIAALGGPTVGIVAYFALFVGGLIGLAALRRSRG